MNRAKIDAEAKRYYEDNIVGEPLDQDVPIACFTDGAEFVLAENKKNYKRALKTLEPIQKAMISMELHGEWMKIVNSLRLCAGMELIELLDKNGKKL